MNPRTALFFVCGESGAVVVVVVLLLARTTTRVTTTITAADDDDVRITKESILTSIMALTKNGIPHHSTVVELFLTQYKGSDGTL